MSLRRQIKSGQESRSADWLGVAACGLLFGVATCVTADRLPPSWAIKAVPFPSNVAGYVASKRLLADLHTLAAAVGYLLAPESVRVPAVTPTPTGSKFSETVSRPAAVSVRPMLPNPLGTPQRAF